LVIFFLDHFQFPIDRRAPRGRIVPAEIACLLTRDVANAQSAAWRHSRAKCDFAFSDVSGINDSVRDLAVEFIIERPVANFDPGV